MPALTRRELPGVVLIVATQLTSASLIALWIAPPHTTLRSAGRRPLGTGTPATFTLLRHSAHRR